MSAGEFWAGVVIALVIFVLLLAFTALPWWGAALVAVLATFVCTLLAVLLWDELN